MIIIIIIIKLINKDNITKWIYIKNYNIKSFIYYNYCV